MSSVAAPSGKDNHHVQYPVAKQGDLTQSLIQQRMVVLVDPNRYSFISRDKQKQETERE
jgi:hypothetical protein